MTKCNLFVCKLAAAILLLTIAGCGSDDGLQRVRVHGTVSYQGDPVMDGQIRFCPESGTEGPISIVKIVEGNYTHEVNGGVPAGKHRIRVQAWDHTLPMPEGPTAPERPQLLPAKYNKDSDIVFDLEYQSGWLEKDFDLE